MKLPDIAIISVSVILSLSQNVKSEEEKQNTVFLWPAKIEELKDQPTEVMSPNKKGGVTRIGKILSPSITLFPAPASEKPSPAILICPGGGYSILAIDKEGTDIAKWLNTKGYTAIVLKYSVPNMRAEALKDIQRAMGVIRHRAKEWNINPNQLGVMGFSAGGNLAARLCETYQTRTYEAIDESDKLSCKPDYCMLIYPAWLEADKVNETHPPTFTVQTKDDKLVEDTIPYTEALKAKKIPSEFHLFDVGGHGYGMKPTAGPISTWPELCETWLKATVK